MLLHEFIEKLRLYDQMSTVLIGDWNEQWSPHNENAAYWIDKYVDKNGKPCIVIGYDCGNPSEVSKLSKGQTMIQLTMLIPVRFIPNDWLVVNPDDQRLYRIDGKQYVCDLVGFHNPKDRLMTGLDKNVYVTEDADKILQLVQEIVYSEQEVPV